jgi:hypothetical protein
VAGKTTKKKSRKAPLKKAPSKKAAPTKRAATKVATRRGSPEAIEKRRVARQLNALISGTKSDAGAKLDGRSARKRDRIFYDLKEKSLKPIEVLTRVSDLMAMGETAASIKKAGVRPLNTAFSANTEEARASVMSVQKAYNFPPTAWKFIGVTLPTAETAQAAE